jgi:hypothetical protein
VDGPIATPGGAGRPSNPQILASPGVRAQSIPTAFGGGRGCEECTAACDQLDVRRKLVLTFVECRARHRKRVATPRILTLLGRRTRQALRSRATVRQDAITDLTTTGGATRNRAMALGTLWTPPPGP